MQPRQPGASGAAATRRIWWAIAVGTLVQMVSFLSLFVGVAISVADDAGPAGPAFALGFALAPIMCCLTAFVSGHQRASMAALKGMGVWLAVGIPLGLLNFMPGLTAGFAASGAFTLRSLAVRPGKRRAWAVVFLAAWVSALVFLLPQAALLTAAATPLLAIRLADVLSERAEETAAAADAS